VFDASTQLASARLAADLRRNGINTELYMEDKPLGKQFQYADKKGVPVVAILGPEEVAQGQVKLKRLSDGYETLVAQDSVAGALRQILGE
jgi:histidyl-tRNA synthetase